MRHPTHTPYDGSSKLFSIGLKPLDFDRWIEVDEFLLPHLAEKQRLYAEIPERVFVEEDCTRDAQREVLDLLVAHLEAAHPVTHHRNGADVEPVGFEGMT
ncbi:heme-dependent oxidative N-demethylase subunit alpha family protein, partial [Mesorhizobium sp.]